AGTVGTLPDAIALAGSLGLDPLVRVGDGYAPQIRHPVRWRTYRTAAPTHPPALGEHDAAVRAWLAAPSIPER
ncbi:MAG: hypothetical protein WAL50_07520, partial [Kineosporiaceae bacterium]